MVTLRTGFFYMLIAILWSSAVLAGGISPVAANGTAREHPDIFARESITVAAGQTVGKLLAEGADVIVEGKVTDGIILVDGNLTVKPGARISGEVLVIGGTAAFSPAADLQETALVIPRQNFPLASLLAGSLIILAAAGLLILPAALWWFARLLKKVPFYNKVAAIFFTVQHQWPVLYILGTLLISAMMLTAFVELAWETMFQQTTDVFDMVMIWLTRYFASPRVDQVMIFITDLGYGKPYFLIVSAIFLLILYLKRWREAAGLAICLAGGAVLNLLLKNLFERARPELFRLVEATGYSFPSGHAMVSLCFYGMAAFLLARGLKRWQGRVLVISAAGLLIAAIGVSRVYLGVHYPTDIAAGYAAGSMWLAFCISLLMWWEKER
ncbi:phosphatase PAP2 family protein [Sporomusa sphaeroides]|uniref:Undecaprenyl pyrophosphate phosphatase n=1 Tax=Sporomusa sphaeroides DSM 2875 TaxID=1337886 RepID=A0ABP2CA33_9FIRM|nr:phosphatase PAP2 family protein [Sporomusa sphaeroides]OLS56906.1 putative undecaprenyl-diphosphatase YbjG [Sporomusa sphaeroides DSM 2875]CVK21186.1 undecaprenyl pyrophosphate phosphatase [Sporomusa sphaeroides DSM 2875]